jgi:hypothetical protein
MVMFLVQVWVIGGWYEWWGGARFGQVFFLGFTPAFALGLAWLFASLRPGAPRNALMVCLLGCLVWSAGLGVQYVGGVIPREKEVTFVNCGKTSFSGFRPFCGNSCRICFQKTGPWEIPRLRRRAVSKMKFSPGLFSRDARVFRTDCITRVVDRSHAFFYTEDW